MNKCKVLALSIIAASLLTGCGIQEKLSIDKKDEVIIYEANDSDKRMSEERIINSKNNKKSMTSFNRSEIILNDISEDAYPPKELMEVVDAINFSNQKLGDIINILTSNLNNVSIVYEPNVDLNLEINIRTGKMKLYHLLKMITKNAGYHAYYDAEHNSFNISPYQTRKYKIPAGIFVKKEVEQNLGNAGGSATASINLNSDNPIEAFNNHINMLGSENKLVNFDRSSGTLFVKEHPIYIKEIDDFVVDFVQDRSRKFIVETAIFDVLVTDNQVLGLDLENLTTGGLNPFTITNLTGGGSGAILSYGKKQVGSLFNDDGTEIDYGMNGRAFNAILQMMRDRTNSTLVDKSRTILNNHDVNYIGNGSTVNYVESIETIINESGTTNYVPKTGKAFDGITFVSRVDGFKNKDYIEVSLAPAVKHVTVHKGAGISLNGVIAADLVNEEVRETMSTVNIKDGEIIVIGGLIREEEIENIKSNPLIDKIPLIRDFLGVRGTGTVKIETVFITRVMELHDAEQSYRIPTSNVKGVIDNKF